MQLILNARKSSKRESFQFRLTSQTIVFVEKFSKNTQKYGKTTP